MSATPRSDAARVRAEDVRSDYADGAIVPFVEVDFARKLETELNAMVVEKDRLFIFDMEKSGKLSRVKDILKENLSTRKVPHFNCRCWECKLLDLLHIL